MKDRFGARVALLAFVGLLLFGLQAEANVVGIVAETYGGDLTNTCDYDWWYGCSPTSAGMMMGYYDRNGYEGLLYGNLCPGGVAETSTYGMADWSALAHPMIASQEHVDDYWGTDSPPPFHADNCLADFMETSQGQGDGSTTFYYYTNGAPFTYQNAEAHGVTGDSGMYGMYEYVQYAGYDVTDPTTDVGVYNQYSDNRGLTYGFTFEQYKAEIDAGRPVLIHVVDHTMLGYGYNDTGNQVTLYDTWTPGPHYMTWGGSYSGLEMVGVTVLELTGGDVPEPTVLVGLLSMIPVGTFFWWRRRRK